MEYGQYVISVPPGQRYIPDGTEITYQNDREKGNALNGNSGFGQGAG